MQGDCLRVWAASGIKARNKLSSIFHLLHFITETNKDWEKTFSLLNFITETKSKLKKMGFIENRKQISSDKNVPIMVGIWKDKIEL